MNAKSDNYELSELCDQAGVTRRTVRYYVQQGLLPAPGMGPGTKYGQGHLDRLRLIRRYQRDHLPLAEIRKRLEQLDDADVVAILSTPGSWGAAPATTSTAAAAVTGGGRGAVADYVASVLHDRSPAASVAISASVMPSKPSSAPYERDRWDRFRLNDDVEIHVRRPLSREMNRRVEKLLEAAQDILGEKP